MKVTNKIEGAGDNQHLLDISSDFNNYSNLAYFISEYKKAKQIIRQCKSFYRNFLMSKLYTIDELKTIDNVNLLQFRFNWSEYINKCTELFKYIVYKDLQNEIKKSNLTKYQFGFYEVSPYLRKYRSEYETNVWEFHFNDDALITSIDYFDSLLFSSILRKYKLLTSKDELHSNSEDNLLDAIEVHRANTKVIKNYDVITKHIFEYSFKHSGYIDTGKTAKYVLFGDEENTLVKIVQQIGEKYSTLLKDIICNPENHYNEWLDFTEFMKSYYKFNGHVANTHFYLFAPVDYIIDGSSYVIDAYQFLNTDYVKYKIKYDDDIDEYDSQHTLYYNINKSSISDLLLLKNTSLMYHIQETNPNYHKVKKLYDDKEFKLFKNTNYYFILIDNVPFRFSDDLDNVKIQYDEEKNILKCSYVHEDKYKKWAWPSDTPWTVDEYFYDLEFDCSTNEPIYYNYHKSTHEEKCRYR